MSRRIKRKRRTKAEMEALKSGLYDILLDYNPQTVRGVFYQAVRRELIEKNERAYQNAVQRNLVIMRETGEVPFEWITDASRWMQKPDSYSSVQEAIENAQQFYRKELWASQPDHVEFWMEKETLAGIIYPITSKYDIPLMVTHGFSSISFLHESAQYIKQLEKPTYIYCLSDYDKAGRDLGKHIERKLHQYAPESEIYFEIIAVTKEQIDSWDLPTRPPKGRDKKFKACVELDAIPAYLLVELIEQTILNHISYHEYEQHLLIEQAERESFSKALAAFN